MNKDAYNVITPNNFDLIRRIFEQALQFTALGAKPNITKAVTIERLINEAGLKYNEAIELYNAEFDDIDVYKTGDGESKAAV